MKKRMATGLLALLLSAAVTVPVVSTALPVAAAETISLSWSVNTVETTITMPSKAQTAFDTAMQSYTGEALTPLAYYSLQVVSGYNLCFLCRQGGANGQPAVLKQVEIYQNGNGSECTVSSVQDFDLMDYMDNYRVPLADDPAPGSSEIVSNPGRSALPEEAAAVYEQSLRLIDGVQYDPLAYLGKQQDGTDTNYAYLCYTSTVTQHPDVYIDVVIVQKNAEGKLYLKSTHSLMGKRTWHPAVNGLLNYTFEGDNQYTAGYAEGTLSLTAEEAGTYQLYWADDSNALDGYYPIGKLKLKAGETGTIHMGYHTAIPVGARRVIATTGSTFVADAYSVWNIPYDKRLSWDNTEKPLYTFNTFSDIHIDKGSLWYVNAEANLKQALKFSVNKDVDYIVVSGDVVTNDSGPDKEWDAYQKVLSRSDYVNPVWESDGNHDMRQSVSSGLKSFVKGSGTDGSDSGLSYFSMTEEKTGDLFIFMSLELSKSPQSSEEFSDKQLAWVTKLLEENASTRNVFLVQHAPVKGFGAGDRMSNPYYKGLLNTDYASNQKFKELLLKYPNIVFLSGHTHEDFVMNYNYDDANGTAAHMIHTPSLAGSTMPNSSDDGLERNGGKGFNSQGYYVEVYRNSIIFYGANITDEKIYPLYSYIMEGGRDSSSPMGTEPAPLNLTGQTVAAQDILQKTKAILERCYAYASYDAYQALKKLYYQYRNEISIDTAVMSLFEQRINALAHYTGDVEYHPLLDTYYFINNKKWDKVYAYAWNSSSDKLAEWPGVKLDKVGTNDDGNDVYAVHFASAGQYGNLIFDAGSNQAQTVDIDLTKYAGNAFYIGSSSDSKYTVKNCSWDDGNNPPPPPEPEEQSLFLRYYVTDEHDWTKLDTAFTKNSDGQIIARYTASSDKTFSFCVFDDTDKQYYCVSESQKFTYAPGEEQTYTLTAMSSRGKSISVYGLADKSTLDLIYDPLTKKITVRCEAKEPEKLANLSTCSAETIQKGASVTVNAKATGGTGGYTYGVYYKKQSSTKWSAAQSYQDNPTVTFTPAAATVYDICVKVKDSSGTIAKQYFTVTVNDTKLSNRSTLSADTIKKGKSVIVNAKATGGTGGYTYGVYYKKQTATKWSAAQSYKANSTITVTPAAAVTYDICVKVKDSSGTIAKKYFTLTVTR